MRHHPFYIFNTKFVFHVVLGFPISKVNIFEDNCSLIFKIRYLLFYFSQDQSRPTRDTLIGILKNLTGPVMIITIFIIPLEVNS